MLYLDTSVLTSLFKAEARSPAVERLTRGLPPRLPTVSSWTRVEFASLFAKNVRMGLTTTIQAQAAEKAFDLFVEEGCTLLDIERRDCDLARRLLADHRSGLRSGDALHLAVASNAAAAGVCSLDRVMIAVGRSLGLPMNPDFPVPT